MPEKIASFPVTTSSVQRLQRSVIEFCLFVLLFSSLNAELIIPATGNVFYAMTSSSVDFLLRRKGGNTPLGSQPINTETSATFPRIKAKGRRLVRTLFWQRIFFLIFAPQRQTLLIAPTGARGRALTNSECGLLCAKTKLDICLLFRDPATLALPKTPRPSPPLSIFISDSRAGSVKHFKPLRSPEPSAAVSPNSMHFSFTPKKKSNGSL